MKLTVNRVDPPLEVIALDSLPGKGLLRKEYELCLESGRIAFHRHKDRWHLYCPAGEGRRVYPILHGSELWGGAARFQVAWTVADCGFKNGSGRVDLAGSFEVLPDQEAHRHPLAQQAGLFGGDFWLQLLERCLRVIVDGFVATILGEVLYEPGQTRCQALGQALGGLQNDPGFRKVLLEQAGLRMTGDLGVEDAWCQDLEDREEARRTEQASTERKRRDTAEKVQDIVAHAVVRTHEQKVELSEADHKRHLLEKQLEQELRVHHAQAQKDAIDVEIDMIKDHAQCQAELRRLKVEHRTRIQELEAIRAEHAAQAQEQVDGLTLDGLRKDLEVKAARSDYWRKKLVHLDALTDQVRVMSEAIAAIMAHLDAPRQVPLPELAVDVRWEAFRPGDKGGLRCVDPDVRTGARLASGTYLGVQVTCSTNAYVYVALKGSSGTWQILVPDADGLMGGLGSNAQSADCQTAWPGVCNRPAPAGMLVPPYWQLDDTAGWEHFLVVASLVPIRVEDLRSDSGVAAVRGVGVTRGVQAPGPLAHGQTVQGDDPRTVRNRLVGLGCVVADLIVEHY
jgi:hypothetical protein